MKYVSRKEMLDNNYRRVEAMYRKGIPFKDIGNALGLTTIDVLDITQKIFALDMKKLGRES